jgi:coenzyme F420 hydrogenase subunit beta
MMKSGDYEGQRALISKVFDQGMCVKCGACVGLCPHFNYWDGEVVVLDPCRADTWRCLQYCPRAEFQGTEPASKECEREGSLGPIREVRAARSSQKEVSGHAQYGGVVSTLLIRALKTGLIRAAIVTDAGSDGLSPAGRVVRSTDEIVACSGSRYVSAGTLAALNGMLRESDEALGVVGLPCQMEALARMGRSQPDGRERMERVKIKIGLFCTWALDARSLRSLLTEKQIAGCIKKYDIPPPPAEAFMVLTETGWTRITLDDIRGLVQKGCRLCDDMTSEWADISVGVVEGRSLWNTVIIRTEAGADLFREAVSGGFLESEALSKENLEHLKKAAASKKQRAEMNRLED